MNDTFITKKFSAMIKTLDEHNIRPGINSILFPGSKIVFPLNEHAKSYIPKDNWETVQKERKVIVVKRNEKHGKGSKGSKDSKGSKITIR